MMCSILHSNKNRRMATPEYEMLYIKFLQPWQTHQYQQHLISRDHTLGAKEPHCTSHLLSLLESSPCQAASQMLRAAMDRLDSQSAALPLASPGIHRAAPSHQRSVQNPQRRQSCRPIALPHRSLIRIVCKHHFEIQGG